MHPKNQNIQSIDINCDMGEGGGYDAEIMPLISSCNIACGGHYGDKKSMEESVRLALTHKVNLGVHPSYPDKENFGRKTITISIKQLQDNIYTQISTFIRIAKGTGATLHHVKAHGALYHDLNMDRKKAEAFLEVLQEFDKSILLWVSPQSILKECAEKQNRPTKVEGFADRNYEADFSLVSRKKENALITKKEQVLAHILPMIKKNCIHLPNGEKLHAQIDTLCLHSDTQNSLAILKYLNAELPKNKIQIL